MGAMPRVLVVGDGRFRGDIAERLSAASEYDVVDCDPALGDCVMYARLEGVRYAGFVFVGFDDPATRGALAVVAERSVLVPLLDPAGRRPDPVTDGYLFRLPRAIGFRDSEEQATVLNSIPGAADVPGELVGNPELDATGLARLLAHTSSARWQWSDLVQQVVDEVAALPVTRGPQ